MSQAIVLPVPDPTLSNVPGALIVPGEKHRWSDVAQQQIVAEAEKRLAEPFFELPRYFKLVSELPRNSAGKIDRQAARKLLPYRQPPRHIRVRLKPIKLLRLAIRGVRRRAAWRLLLQRPCGFLRLVRKLWKGEIE